MLPSLVARCPVCSTLEKHTGGHSTTPRRAVAGATAHPSSGRARPVLEAAMTKRALCVGINDYPGTNSDLRGCVNDARDWANELTRRGYTVDTLLDKEASRAGIVDALTALIDSAGSGDSRVFTFSGHGSWLPDEDGDEDDDRDEMLCPHDINRRQYLMDDDLAEIFARKATGVSLFFVSDSCHSGTVARFRPPFDPRARETAPLPRFLPPATFLKDADSLAALTRAVATPRVSRQKYPAVLLAGCRDFEYSYDAYFNGRPNGAMTAVALQALKNNPGTPRKWVSEIRKHLPSAVHPQTPQLYGSRTGKSGPMF
jgi:hypothetical protein